MLLIIILFILIFGFGYGGYRVGPGWGYYGGGKRQPYSHNRFASAAAQSDLIRFSYTLQCAALLSGRRLSESFD
jgi:hypothetical protein